MPTYHYQCKACKHDFEEFQSMSAAPLLKCPKCGKKKLVRIISGAGLVFKGSGFYLTDYKKQGSSHSDSPRDLKPTDSGDKETKSTAGADKDSKPSRGADADTKRPSEHKKGKGGSSTGGSTGGKG